MERNYAAALLWDGELPEDSYLRKLPTVRYLMAAGRLEFPGAVTFLVGENGTGKSTLLEGLAVAAGFNPEGGTKNFLFSTRDTHSSLHENLTIARRRYPKDGFFLRAESFYNVATNVDELDRIDHGMLSSYGGRSLHDQSHGESFLSLVKNRMGGHGLYLMDEPEAALSPMGQMTLLTEFHRLVESDSQLIVATHSPILMAYPGASVYVLDEDGVHLTPYEETEHVRLTKYFLNNPQRMIHLLLEQSK